jgi:hypothetical protein
MTTFFHILSLGVSSLPSFPLSSSLLSQPSPFSSVFTGNDGVRGVTPKKKIEITVACRRVSAHFGRKNQLFDEPRFWAFLENSGLYSTGIILFFYCDKK